MTVVLVKMTLHCIVHLLFIKRTGLGVEILAAFFALSGDVLQKKLGLLYELVAYVSVIYFFPIFSDKEHETLKAVEHSPIIVELIVKFDSVDKVNKFALR